jgi:hypothetical protein
MKHPNATHGLSKTLTWWRWLYMLKRCRKGYAKVCKRWLKFENFLHDMGKAKRGKVIDRRRNSRGYSPSNCRWVTPKQSTENRRNTVWIRFKGERMRVEKFAKIVNLKQYVVYARLSKGWTPARIAATPCRAWRT